jgi:hypothetical protein
MKTVGARHSPRAAAAACSASAYAITISYMARVLEFQQQVRDRVYSSSAKT